MEMKCSTHNHDFYNPPKAYIVPQRCVCAAIPSVFPHPKAAILGLPRDQSFSLSRPLIHYILASSQPVFLSKLRKTCKLLNSQALGQRGFAITVLNFQHCYATLFDPHNQNFIVSSSNPHIEPIFKNLVTSGRELILSPHRNDINLASKFLSAVKSCTFRRIEILNQRLSMEELTKLLGPWVKAFKGHSVALKTSSIARGDIEEIVEKIPNADTIVLENISFGSNTAESLALIPRNCKITNFEITHVPETFDRQNFVRFIKQNIAASGSVVVRFGSEASKSTRDKLRKALKKMTKKEFAEAERPTISVACPEYFYSDV